MMKEAFKMTACETIQNSLKELLKTKNLDKISVDDICNHSFVSRSTFYKHYSNKYDVVEQIFKDDTVNALNDLLKILPVSSSEMDILTHKWFFQRFYDNREFYKALFLNEGNNWFVERFIKECADITAKYTQDIGKTMSPKMHEYTCYYIAASQAMLLSKWLSEDCPISPDELAASYYEWNSSYWRRNFGDRKQK